ncbi:hypothetical protein BOX15_Mlig025898g5 [Macrostomum lignano]|uniref:5'-Nucleotidase C-terminal domain-containing protein n=1 Tax=Macrostomum lignano TaxID=282301 RepID=A0A267DG82_9PLAT|nr:hypothetical protein BOX15_Mlig025898g5 [Macrostomum lignano]
MPNARQLHILHFNDVYNIEPAGHIGGAARFVTALRSFAELQPLVLFSGDVFSPSTISTATRGQHLVQVLKACNIDAACFGNHDFDFGVDNLVQCSQETGFPWLLSNIIDRETGRPLAEGLETVCIDHRASGLRIGIVGLVELEWVDTLSTVDPEDIRFFDFCTRGEQLAAKLKSEQSCDLVIALTHMRWPNDRKLARAAHHIDIILGGHDHNYGIEFVNNRAIVKSGTDFRQFSVVSLSIDKSSPLEVKIQTVDVDSSKYSEDPEVAKAVESHVENLEKSMQRVLGQVDCPLECRFEHIRTKETNMGNFMCDIVLTALQADFVLVNSGSFRADCVVPAGDFRLGDLSRLFPMLDPLVVISIDGRTLLATLENGVSMWPALEGRFPQVSGLRFRFDGTRPPGSRVDPSSVQIGDKPMVADTQYRMATKYYLYCGKDGYDMLPGCQLLVDDEDGPVWSVAVQNYFTASGVLRGWLQLKNRHRCRLRPMNRRLSCVVDSRPETEPETAGPPPTKRSRLRKNPRENWATVRREFAPCAAAESNSTDEEPAFAAPRPSVEGRIVETSGLAAGDGETGRGDEEDQREAGE